MSEALESTGPLDAAHGVRCLMESRPGGKGPSEGEISDNIRLAFETRANYNGSVNDVTVKLQAAEGGDPGAAEELFVLLYAELRRNAAGKLKRELPGQTLQPTALVHEAWIRLVGDQNLTFSSRAQFFHAASEAMRRILIDRARRKRTQRHGGRYRRVDLEGFDLESPEVDESLLAVHEVLDKFACEYPVQAKLVKLKYFAGMTNEEIAEIMGICLTSVKNYWAFARAWFLNEIQKG
jgi:RNA polymerase sigma factor (TIGR02999 family)